MFKTFRLSAAIYRDDLFFMHDSFGSLVGSLANRAVKALGFLLAAGTFGYVAMTMLIHPITHHTYHAQPWWGTYLYCLVAIVLSFVCTWPKRPATQFIERYTRKIALLAGLLLAWPTYLTQGVANAALTLAIVNVIYLGLTIRLKPLPDYSDYDED